jgi:hypothetical protein
LKQQAKWQSRHEGVDIVGKPLIKNQANSDRSQQGHKTMGALLNFNNTPKGSHATRASTLQAS